MKTILVTGDPICDHNYYKGERPTADSNKCRGFRFAHEGGGALLLRKLIGTVMQGTADWQVEFGLDGNFRTLPLAYHAFCLWEPQVGNPTDDPKEQVQFWRALQPPLGYGHKEDKDSDGPENNLRSDAYAPPAASCTESPDVVVIDDAGIGFRSAFQRTLCSSLKGVGTHPCPRWVVLKLTGPIGASPLWDELTNRCDGNLVVIVPAEELRRREVRLSRGLSWEATAEDLTAEIFGNPRLKPLRKARHLIVTFQSDAAYWLDNALGTTNSLLVFDAHRAEGEWSESQGKGGAFGFLSCFTAAVVRELCLTPDQNQPDIETAIGAGLSAGRALRHLGHGPVVDNGAEPKPGFPFAQITAEISQPTEKFVSALIPHAERVRGDWMMLDEWQKHARKSAQPRPHYEAALAVAVLGPEALERFPVAQFGSYQTVDRKEIESLRTIRQLIINYTKVPRQKTPLNLGVFGPPGSGKSYIVIEIAKAVLNIKDEGEVLLFNLSQFSSADDLFGAFHQIRDRILKGETPLVFWDEFDAQGYRWLQYLLAPMEDGAFQDGQITHPIGKCIFVFAGATSATFDKFGPCNPDSLEKGQLQQLIANPERLREMERAWREFVLAKGPDFKSRLVGYLNILGVNPKLKCEETDGRRVWSEDEKDLCFPIRRALFMRGLFKVKPGQRLELDPDMIRALLEMPKFKGGGRSLQFLCNHLKNSCGKPGRSNLPGYELLDMHVKADLFWDLCEQDMDFVPKAEELAFYLHEAYRLRIKDKPKKKHLDVPLAKLSEDLQKANIAQALRIPGILRLAKMHLDPGPVVQIRELVANRVANLGVETPIRQALVETNNLELLSEAEHNGWMVERMLSDWKYGRKKDDDEKTHDCLIPYSQLSEEVKNYDRWTIIGQPAPADKPNEEQFGYVDIVKTVGLRVVMNPEKSGGGPGRQ